MTMSEFEFSFLVSGMDPHADDFADRFFEAGCHDATLMLTRGLVAVCFAREADNYAQAVVAGYRDVLKAGAVVERFEPDFLVSRSDISKRANLSKAAISLYVSGERGSGFPAPCARITSSNPLWDWVEVSAWLHRNSQLPRDAVVNARISRVVNWVVQSKETLPSPEKALFGKIKDVTKESFFAH
jgi:hypothetical protein